MVDLKLILEQTRGTGINVYTHGEMPGPGLPLLQQYPAPGGNYGSAWQNQQRFANFPGAVVMTSNCIIDPNVGNYSDRIFTRSIVGWPGDPPGRGRFLRRYRQGSSAGRFQAR